MFYLGWAAFLLGTWLGERAARKQELSDTNIEKVVTEWQKEIGH